MVFIIPIQSVSDHEVLYFVLGVVEALCAPFWMFAKKWVGIFIEWLAIEVCQAMGILWEVGWHPVKDDTDLCLVEGVNECHEVFWIAISGSRRIISSYLVTPGAIERIFRNAHQFNVRVAHFIAV